MAAHLWKEFWRAAFSPKYLVITNTLSCVSLLTAADIVQQMCMGASFTASFPPHRYYGHYDYEHKHYRERPKSLDEEDEVRRINWRRTRRVASIGFLTGPMNTYWYRWLERTVKGPISPTNIAIKVAADIASTPAFDSTFIIGVATQEGKSVVEAIAEYRSKFWKILMTSMCVWIPTQTINFWLVPQRFRVVYVALVTFFYNSLLNYIKHDNDPHYTTLRTLIDQSDDDETRRIMEARALTAPNPMRPTVVGTVIVSPDALPILLPQQPAPPKEVAPTIGSKPQTPLPLIPALSQNGAATVVSPLDSSNDTVVEASAPASQQPLINSIVTGPSSDDPPASDITPTEAQ